MNRFTLISVAGALASACAQGAVSLDQTGFLAANPGLTRQDFEGIAPVGDFLILPGYASGGVTFANGGPLDDPAILSNTATSVQFGLVAAPSDYLVQSWDDTPLGFTIDGGAASVGFNVISFSLQDPAGTGLVARVEAFNGATLLESIELTTASLDVFDTFVGFSDLGAEITSILITPAGSFSARVVGIDNLYYGTPVPTPGVLGVLAVSGGMACLRRGRRR